MKNWSILLIGLAAALSAGSHRTLAATRRVTFEEYQNLSEKNRAKLIRHYVRHSPKTGYYEVLLDSYVVRTDVSPEYCIATAVKMDEFCRAFRSIFVGRFRTKARPELFVLVDKDSYVSAVSDWTYGRMKVPGWSAGVFITYGHKYALFGRADAGKLFTILFHEGTHQLLHFYIGRKFPRWFDEGVATNLQDWDVGLSAQRNVCEEIWKSGFAYRLYKMITEEDTKPDLLSLMESRDKDWLDTEDPGDLYAQAWTFVNFLLSNGKAGEKYLNRLITAFRAGKDMRKILPPQEKRTLSSEWNDYIAGVIVPHFEYGVMVPAAFKKRGKEAGEMILAEGLAKFPDNTELLFYKGLIALQTGDHSEAYRILEPLEKRYPRHPHLMRTLGKTALACGDRRKALKWLKTALKENYRDEEVKELLAQAKQPPKN